MKNNNNRLYITYIYTFTPIIHYSIETFSRIIKNSETLSHVYKEKFWCKCVSLNISRHPISFLIYIWLTLNLHPYTPISFLGVNHEKNNIKRFTYDWR